MSMIKQHQEILKRLTDIAIEEKEFKERGQFMNIQKMIQAEIDILKSIEAINKFDNTLEELKKVSDIENTIINSDMIDKCNHPIRMNKESSYKVMAIDYEYDNTMKSGIANIVTGLIDKKTKNLIVSGMFKIEIKEEDRIIQMANYSDFIYINSFGCGNVYGDILESKINSKLKIIRYRPTTENINSAYILLRDKLKYQEIFFKELQEKDEFCEFLETVDSLKEEIRSGNIKLVENRNTERGLFEAFVSLVYNSDKIEE